MWKVLWLREVINIICSDIEIFGENLGVLICEVFLFEVINFGYYYLLL